MILEQSIFLDARELPRLRGRGIGNISRSVFTTNTIASTVKKGLRPWMPCPQPTSKQPSGRVPHMVRERTTLKASAVGGQTWC